ncbi:hypothetical protein ONZ45_g4850 [Pleurotus djamor]|nr:hypothetical protein ONZ45_g4850 [Pleurotus djamor]
MDTLTLQRLALVSLLAAVYVLYRRYRRISVVSRLRGPTPYSFLLGNLKELFQSQGGEADFQWQRQYGGVVRIKGLMGEDRLMISDPKALQYILHTSGYNFLKWPERTELSRILMGRGLLWADGEIHKRQRKVMLPGFGAPDAKSYVPLFHKIAEELSSRWEDIISAAPNQTTVLDIPHWLARATLDAIGEAAFDYQFGALNNTKNDFAESYFGLMTNTIGSPPDLAIVLSAILPPWALRLMSKYSPAKNRAHARYAARVANGVAADLINSKSVKANASEDERSKLTDEELVAELRTILLAGHETVALTLVWTILELARNPQVQHQLRAEIKQTERALHGRRLSATDLDGMPYLSAVLKESMRFHPALYHTYRFAVKDDVLPLSNPIVDTNGDTLTEISIPRGTKLIMSIAAYHRNKDIFGEDVDVFIPERWLKDSQGKGPSLGVYGNLLSFTGGVRTCIGWRLAIYECLTFIVELVSKFEFDTTDDVNTRLRREACLVMLPTLEGEEHKGEQLPISVTLALTE